MDPASSYILDKPEPYRAILLHLQSVIQREIPEAELKYKWRIPFFYLEGKPFCYLNQSGDYVDLGFPQADHLVVHTGLMHSKGRKILKSLRYRTLEDIDDTVLADVLHNAFEVRTRKA